MHLSMSAVSSHQELQALSVTAQTLGLDLLKISFLLSQNMCVRDLKLAILEKKRDTGLKRKVKLLFR